MMSKFGGDSFVDWQSLKEVSSFLFHAFATLQRAGNFAGANSLCPLSQKTKKWKEFFLMFLSESSFMNFIMSPPAPGSSEA